MADVLCSDAAERTADTLLRVNGGRGVWLRLPVPAAANDDEQLGLAAPQFQDVELAPCAFRKAGDTSTLLVSGSTVKAIVGSLQFNSAEVLFETAAGVVVDGVLYLILSSTATTADGKTYGYILELRAPVR